MKKFRWLLALGLVLVCSGCFGSKELNQRAFIVAMAFDEVGEEGEKEKGIRVTAQMPIPAQMGSDQKGGGKTFFIASVTGDTVSEALNKLQRQLDREIFLGHVRLMVFGETLARHRGIEEVVDYFKRDFRIQRITQLALAQGEAEKILEAQPPLEQSASAFIYNVLSVDAGTSEEITTDLGEYLVLDSDEGIEPVLPRLDLQDKSIVTNGAAIMMHDKVKGWMTPAETRGFSILVGEFEPSRIVVSSPNMPEAKIGIQLREAKARNRVSLKNGKLHIASTIQGGFETLEFTGPQGPQPELEKKLEKAVNQAVVRDVHNAIRRAQSFHSDIIGYGRLVRAFYPGYWSKVNWNNEFSQADITVRGKIRWTQSVRRPGR